jgi:hypothetical protein
MTAEAARRLADTKGAPRHPFPLLGPHLAPHLPMKREATAVCLLATVLAMAWTLFAGKDVSWDVLNHHLYLPFSLLTGRYQADLFAAGPQSYLNPLGYIPGYLLVRSGLPAWAVGAALATLHAVPTAWGLHRLSVTLWGPDADQRRWRLLGMAMALCAPIFMMLTGTTSSDPLSAGLLVLAVAAALDRRPGPGLLLSGGLALGLAVAIKPTSGVFAVALAPVLLLRLGLQQMRWVEIATFSVSAVIAALAGMGKWSLWLWQTFGSPVFPLFNNLFRSPYAPVGPTTASRFVPETGWDMLARLWEMAAFKAYTVTEAFVPDLRPVLAAAIVAAVLLLALGRRPTNVLSARSWARADVQLLLLLTVSYPLWMASSANARYLVAWFVLVGIGLTRAVEQLLPARVAATLLAVVLAAQTSMYVSAGDLRFKEVPWDDHAYIDADVAPRLAQEPFLHLSIGVQTFAAVAMFLHPDGALINITGQMAMPMDGPLGDAFKDRLKRWAGRTRFLLQAPTVMQNPKADRSQLGQSRFMTYRFGLDIDWNDCERLRLHVPVSSPPDTGVPSTMDAAVTGQLLLSCGTKPRLERDAALESRIASADAVFRLIETACPQVYGPRPFASDVGSTMVQRLYTNSDARVDVSPTDGVTLSHFRSLSPVSLGSIEQVIANHGQDACAAWKMLSRQ